MKPYPSYRDSGVEWIREISSHWSFPKVRYVTSIDYGNSLKEEDRIEGEYDVYGSNGVVGTHHNSLTNGETIIIGRKGSHGKINLSENPCFPIDTTFFVEQKNTKHDIKWLFYGLGVLRLDSFTKDSSVPGINREEIYERYLPTPPSNEQKQIVSFLDHKTQKIGELIEKTEKKIELLKEKRTSLINYCVTKGLPAEVRMKAGLNPNVEIKDSGVEWIGDIQEHWKVTRLKFLSFIKYGLGQPPRELEDGLPIIRATNISKGNIIPHDLLYADPNDIPYDRNPILQENDIIVVRSGAYTGDSAIIPKEYEGAVAGYDMVVRVHKADPQYIAYSLLSHSVLHNQIDLCRMRAAQPHLNAEELGNTLIFQPPNPEQKQIVSYLDRKTQKIDSTIEKETQRIELLKEYRQSLISEVVTGKIDVREWKK